MQELLVLLVTDLPKFPIEHNCKTIYNCQQLNKYAILLSDMFEKSLLMLNS